ncbi:unnamed protein product [Thelazia callipaeda]|uniref:Pyridoxal kinase n=1 Tax=Thelazia callipaeda TaxID=103827 RepID=A0A0N5D0Q2_THECL|nr:unnamed protein product [Thelazia callipaeda]
MGESALPDIIFKELVTNPSEYSRILSIQSHVVHGYVGNKCSVFILQLHGYDVDPINSVQLSNHAGILFDDVGYKYVKGQKLDNIQLRDIYDGLQLNEINNYSHILTGYCGDASFLLEIANIVKALKKKNPAVLFYCDPVMGDNGRYYVPKELMPIYRDILVPMADVITPNIFELSELIGFSINNETDCLKAINLMHESGIKTVVVTSGLETSTTKFCYGSVYKEDTKQSVQYRFDIPIIPGMFVGTGDIFVSLLLVWMDKLKGDICLAIQKVIGSLQGLLRKTAQKAYCALFICYNCILLLFTSK